MSILRHKLRKNLTITI